MEYLVNEQPDHQPRYKREGRAAWPPLGHRKVRALAAMPAGDRRAMAPHIVQANRNSHTTSTKCQLPRAAKLEAEVDAVGREVSLHGADQAPMRKIVPMSTCAPWKPVAMKNVAPLNIARIVEGRMAVFIRLHAGEQRAEHDGAVRPHFSPAVAMQQRMMRPGDGRAEVSRISVLSSGRCQDRRFQCPSRPHAADSSVRAT